MAHAPNLIIRDGTPADLEACATLDHRLETEWVWQLSLRNDAQDWAVTLRQERLPRPIEIAHSITSQQLTHALRWNQCWLVAELAPEQVIIGYLVMIQDPLHPVGKVRYLCIEPSLRRLGIAVRLLRVSKQWARNHQLSLLHAEIPLKNVPASRLFQKVGFHFCGFNEQNSPESDIVLYYQNSLV